MSLMALYVFGFIVSSVFLFSISFVLSAIMFIFSSVIFFLAPGLSFVFLFVLWVVGFSGFCFFCFVVLRHGPYCVGLAGLECSTCRPGRP